MKKLLILATALAVSAFANESGIEKSGFLTTEACAKTGSFTNCYLENYACGSDGCFEKTEAGVDKNTPLVLYSHNDGVIYKLDTSALKRSDMDQGLSRNEVTIVGELDSSTNTIIASEFRAPPPPKKSFFKGCL